MKYHLKPFELAYAVKKYNIDMDLDVMALRTNLESAEAERAKQIEKNKKMEEM